MPKKKIKEADLQALIEALLPHDMVCQITDDMILAGPEFWEEVYRLRAENEKKSNTKSPETN